MSWTEWIANQHAFFVHLPTAMAVFLPLPLIAAQRMGRGIRPWWLVCRYLAIVGFLGLILTMLSGYVSAPSISPLKSLVTATGRSSLAVLMVRHQITSTICLVLGVFTLLAMFRKRKDHEGFGLPTLAIGILWSAAILVAHHQGSAIADMKDNAKKAATTPAPAPPPATPLRKEDPESALLLKLLDFQSLSPVHTEPVRSKVHGDRWIRVWVSPEALGSYRSGSSLPNGALVVMSSLEDRWGRPSYEPGPLYALEMKEGKPILTYYWAQVPESKRAETGGLAKAHWQGADPKLQTCLACHAQGIAPLKDRSRLGIPRAPRNGTASPGASPAK